MPNGAHSRRGKKLEQLFGMSLDDIYQIMSWPAGELDPFRLSVRMQVTRVVFMAGVKARLNGSLGERNRDGALERIEAAIHARTRGGSEDSGSIG
jgi:hypothetical protein